ncbi:unnamed protein product (macronuclear) [Paramecium tetraurelia]|uniref:Zinc finger C3HC4 RING-type domain-containing protein n=1 Tax=Paramecium tetraurelia TaxID=5888 RepID=A0DCY4_PARTE|nr:uncharacterized protein GSPATT00015760001 [Paramecium tetraurelia]CAK80901.1 unnamed protein product [Paramecium tetraurelia]|eukprot:XP_001448298.1 hypothetical protein (macronuclear) [Paramecium tetraurelia strain d4-2]
MFLRKAKNQSFNLCNIALKCEDNNKQRQLWILQIGLMLEKGGKYVKQIVQLTREIPLIKADDILPYLTQNIKLDDFIDEICETLEEYHDQIEKQQNELEGYIKSNENLKKLLLQTSNRYIFVSQKTKCKNCFRKLFQEDYIASECSHGFHRECILQYVKSNPTVLDEKTYLSMLYLENSQMILKNCKYKQTKVSLMNRFLDFHCFELNYLKQLKKCQE